MENIEDQKYSLSHWQFGYLHITLVKPSFSCRIKFDEVTCEINSVIKLILRHTTIGVDVASKRNENKYVYPGFLQLMLLSNIYSHINKLSLCFGVGWFNKLFYMKKLKNYVKSKVKNDIKKVKWKQGLFLQIRNKFSNISYENATNFVIAAESSFFISFQISFIGIFHLFWLYR